MTDEAIKAVADDDAFVVGLPHLAGEAIQFGVKAVFCLRGRSPVHVRLDHLQQKVRPRSLLALCHRGEPPAHLVGQEQLVTGLAADHRQSWVSGMAVLDDMPSPEDTSGLIPALETL